MIGRKPGRYWRICWKYLAPGFIIVVFVASVIKMGIDGVHYKRFDETSVSHQLNYICFEYMDFIFS